MDFHRHEGYAGIYTVNDASNQVWTTFGESTNPLLAVLDGATIKTLMASLDDANLEKPNPDFEEVKPEPSPEPTLAPEPTTAPVPEPTTSPESTVPETPQEPTESQESEAPEISDQQPDENNVDSDDPQLQDSGPSESASKEYSGETPAASGEATNQDSEKGDAKSLAETGTQVTGITVAAVLLLIAGAVLFTRKRRQA